MGTDAQTPVLSPYAVLAREHRLIERVLNVLGRMCDEIRRTKKEEATGLSRGPNHPLRQNSRRRRALTEAIRIEADAYRKSLDTEQVLAKHDPH
jgi:hypothetical protein